MRILEWLLSRLFPPKLKSFSVTEDMPEIQEYQQRLNRRGIELKPNQTDAVRVVKIVEKITEHAPDRFKDSQFFTVSGK